MPPSGLELRKHQVCYSTRSSTSPRSKVTAFRLLADPLLELNQARSQRLTAFMYLDADHCVVGRCGHHGARIATRTRDEDGKGKATTNRGEGKEPGHYNPSTGGEFQRSLLPPQQRMVSSKGLLFSAIVSATIDLLEATSKDSSIMAVSDGTTRRKRYFRTGLGISAVDGDIRRLRP